ncbi:hypothetical protein [Prosthecobacter vanneervenii]|uniref:Uncharacterized protein n=1 Tax=Prosthecobacter vanneervenii TaxID=48466 RepID=A0A7W7YDF5_9BACT|nr:hypothetical protein [Prosthecobacter vanneervenii]MBB5034059.1 hypothetical protein [Prosthecobacter vanneervenii]
MGAVVHESRSPSFPDAWEHQFPLTEIGGTGVPASVISCIGKEQASAATAFTKRLAALKSPAVREFADLFKGMLPCSVMVQGMKCWLVMKRADDQHSPTQFGNVIMVPALTQSLEWPPEVAGDFAHASYMLEFLEQFGGLTVQVPPSGCCMSCNDRPFVMREKVFPGLGEWDGSLAFFYPGNGDVMLARPDGSAGVWQHEFSADYDQNNGSSRFSSILSSMQTLLPRVPEPRSLPPDCVAILENNILIQIRDEIKALMVQA